MTPMSRLARGLRRAALGAGLAACASLPAHAEWWNADWQNRVKINADNGPKAANVAEAIGRTQVLIRLTQGNFKFDSAKPDGSDIRFVAGDDKTPLHYHIEKWDGLVDQVALIWVDVPDLAPGSVSSFFMYWGNDKAADTADSKASYDPDQLLVWHFADKATLAKDATGYGNNALTAYKRDEAGIIGFGARLDGTAPIKLAPSPSLAVAAGGAYTWQAWIKPGAAAQTSVLFSEADPAGPALEIGLAAGAPYVQAVAGVAAPPLRAQAASPLAGDGWHLLTITASDKLRVYVDGNRVAETAGALPAVSGQAVLGGSALAPAAPAAPAPTAAPATPPAAGAAATPAAPAAAAPFVGQIDELQISKVVRQDGAIQEAVHTQGPNANLLSFETPEQTSAFGSGYIGILLRSITPDAEVVIGILMVMMLISWVVMGNRAVVVGATRGANRRFRLALRDTMKKHGASDILPALPKDAAAGFKKSSLLAIYDTGVREVHERLHGGRCLPDGSIAPQSLAAIRSAMDAQMVREGQKLNNLMVLLTIAIAGGPFIGLLGTVVGVMITFAAIAASGDVNVNSIAPGIAAALLATVAGLAVAIPSLFGYNYFQTRIKETMAEMAVFVDEIVTRIAEGNLGRGAAPGE